MKSAAGRGVNVIAIAIALRFLLNLLFSCYHDPEEFTEQKWNKKMV